MKLYCCQLDIEWENKRENFRKVREALRTAAPEPGSLFVLPEMFATGFTMNVAGMAESEESETEAFLAGLAREFNIFLLGGLPRRTSSPLGVNQAVTFSPEGQLIARYTKIHPFSAAGELDHYQRGASLQFFEWNGLKVAPFICYDLRFPEIFRAAARAGAEMMIVIANWPDRREQHWVRLLEARAIENLAWVAGVNRVGKDPSSNYPGRTLIIDPQGGIVRDAGSAECVISADVSRDAVASWRGMFPALRDMHWRE